MSNRLPIILQEIKTASVVFERAAKMTADTIIVMGSRLVEAKGLCSHGEWQDFLKQTGIPLRSAQRYMRVVQAGMDAEYLQVVGLLGALAEIDEAQKLMPPPSHGVIATWEGEEIPDVMIWWSTGKFRASFAQVYTYEHKGSHTSACFFDDMPTHLVAFMIDVFARGLWFNDPRLELSRRLVGQDELTHALKTIRKAAGKGGDA